MTLTIVTSFLNYYQMPLEESTVMLRLQKIHVLLKMKIPIVVYVSPDCLEPLKRYIGKWFSNQNHIKLVPLAKHIYDSSYAFLIAKNITLNLPKNRLPPKDTIEYMCYLHSKIGFLQQVSTLNPFRSKHFAWMDYDIGSMWNDSSKNTMFLQHIAKHGIKRVTHMPPTEFSPSLPVLSANEIIIPTCWDKCDFQIEQFCDNVCWRFCTNFFIGTSVAIQHLYYLYTECYEIFLTKHNTMVWDMNFFAYLEKEKNWKPITYKANHDDSMIQNFPIFTMATFLDGKKHEYRFPKEDAFLPSSLSCVEHNGKKHLNVRYVNYEYLPSGHCKKCDYVCTVNKYTTLNDDYTVTTECQDLKEDVETTGLQEPDPEEMFQGIEDIRLYTYMNSLKFSATTVNFSGCARSRIVYGDYNIYNHSLKNVKVIPSPKDAFKEKNWIPFVPIKEPYRNYFIYSWTPFCIGEVNERGTLDMIHIQNVRYPFKEEIRGSSNVVYDNGEYVALVHISIEETLPKQYYHMLVWLDEDTYCPKRMSKLFCFEKYGVEFCLSMMIEKNEYMFLFSSEDRNPSCMKIERSILDNTKFDL